MPKRKPSRLQIGDQVGGWKVIEELAGYAHANRRVAYQRVRVECLTCGKSLSLTATQVSRTPCADCASKVAPVQPELNPELEARILYAYRVHLKICFSMYLAPTPFELFAKELRDHPELLDDAPPQREAAQYERRDYAPLYNNGAN